MAVAVVIAVAVSGCGSSHPVELGSTPATQATTATQTTMAAPTPSTSLPEAGTITLSGNGTTVNERFRLGPLGEGQAAVPPAAVLEGCNASYNSPSVIDASAYVEGELTLSYVKGTVPTEVSFTNLENNLAEVEQAAGIPDKLAVYVNGGWTCDEESPPTLTLKPQEERSLDVWLIFPDDLTNEHPRLSQSGLGVQALTSPLSVSQITTGPREAFSGPKAADCQGRRHLLPFARLPFTATTGRGLVNERTVTCRSSP